MALVWHLSDDRPRTREQGRETRHSFSFGAHYDPANVGFAGLMAHNDDRLAPGAGYPEHAHADVEIVTWVVSGALVHRDAGGGAADLGAGSLQVQSAGAGIRHSEIADSASGPTRFVQTWLRPDAYDAAPARVVAAADPALAAGGLVPLVSGDGHGLAPIGTASATLWVARLTPGERVTLPEDPLQHVFVVTGEVGLAERRLTGGDAVRVTDEPGHRVVARASSEVMVWSFRR